MNSHRSRMLWLVGATFPVAIVSALSWFGVFALVNGYLVRGLGWSNAQWTLATLFMSGSMLIWYPAYTEISAAIGRRRAVTSALLVVATAFALLALSPHRFVVYAAMSLMGASTAAFTVAWNPFMADAGGERPGQAMALSMFALNVTGAGVLLVGGQLTKSENYVRMFWEFTAVCGLSALVFHLLSGHIHRMLDADPEHLAAHHHDPVSIRALSVADIRALATGPFMVVLIVGICGAPFAFHTANQIFPNLMRDAHGWTESRIATLVGIGRLPSILILLIVSRLVDRLNIVRAYGVGLLCDGLNIILLGWAPFAPVAAGIFILFNMGHGIVWGTALPAINTCVVRRLRDSAFALTGMAEVGAVFLAGLVHNRLIVMGQTLNFVFFFCGGVTVLAGAVLFAYSFHRHAAQGAPDANR